MVIKSYCNLILTFLLSSNTTVLFSGSKPLTLELIQSQPRGIKSASLRTKSSGFFKPPPAKVQPG
jgi:hypothetical protein